MTFAFAHNPIVQCFDRTHRISFVLLYTFVGILRVPRRKANRNGTCWSVHASHLFAYLRMGGVHFVLMRSSTTNTVRAILSAPYFSLP